MRRPVSFSVSLCVHGSVLAWVALGSVVPPAPKTLYDMAIRPHEDRLIWYKLADKLPDISPAEPAKDHRPPRATRKFEQSIVAGERDDQRPPQLIWTPAPEIQTPKTLPLPNVVAMAAPRPLRKFTPPEPVAKPKAAPNVPDAPAAPAIKTAATMPLLPTPERPAALPFKAPPMPHTEVAPATVGAAPDVQMAVPAAETPLALAGLRRGFVAPPRATAPAPAPAVLAPAPEASDGTAMSGDAKAAMVIAGLDPSKVAEVPAPPGSRSAAFSAGPKLNPTGGQGGSGAAGLQVPGLMVSGGAKEDHSTLVAKASPTSPENLAAAAHVTHAPAPLPAPPAGHPATRVSTSPDPRLYGRAVYSMAIQMPNVTSYSGSWLVWFAEHEVSPGGPIADVQAPEPIRKVDPRYVPSAAEERVEGKVRLWAVINKDGTVSSVSLLSHLDDRLDQSAQEALAKWTFRPARYAGVAVEVDAVFEVPFHLAPKPPRR
jgi:TonB family protein